MCETYIRSRDCRRIAKQGIREDADQVETSDSDDDDTPLDFARNGRNSAKASFLAKALGPVMGYGSDFKLVQFVYDLWLWSSLGAKRNKLANKQPMRLAMSGYSFSPEYWATRHAALIDGVKQLGFPDLFITLAPYEWSFPYHEWVVDEMTRQLRKKLRHPVAETLHIAHVLAQTVVGLLTGANKQSNADTSGKVWASHILGTRMNIPIELVVPTVTSP